MIVGILGVGHLAAALVTGLNRAGLPSQSILLSSRGRSRELSERYHIPVCADTAELVRRSDIIVLAVRPHDAAKALEGLTWRVDQVLVSVCAGVSLSALPAAPAQRVRAMPLTAAEINASPTIFFPDIPKARWLIEKFGPAIALRNEREFEVATVNAAIYGWAQVLVRQSAEWCAAQGADGTAMRQLVAQTFVAAGRLIAERDQPMEDLLSELVTPGGITELGLKIMEVGGQPAVWREACEAVLARLTGAAAG
ncbi:NAD(P)-binding domain-containing protein [Rhizobium sp. BK602]|uniref:pyrroline-5-carboxylate reductase family protein n=1 Tax=Rhizobium sp. BK602 TaxID=2586986 RepID=UPI0016076ED3|nr:NAD(P)-binding domain-containing protein [Rhizobium sp. BK602]MBB3610853.1 pyrroline-5-carboxylate reductase [Rhizobium sp. BK602]